MSQEYKKDFDEWNNKKKILNEGQKQIFCHTREIWWSSLGLNIGIETDGKNKNFERPVLIIGKYNKRSIVVLPITTKIKDDAYHYKIFVNNIVMYVKLTQVRTIDSKRLLRKIGVVPILVFNKIIEIWKSHF